MFAPTMSCPLLEGTLESLHLFPRDAQRPRDGQRRVSTDSLRRKMANAVKRFPASVN